MFNYSKRNITILAVLITVFIYCSINYFCFQKNLNSKKEESSTIVLKISIQNPVKLSENVQTNLEENTQTNTKEKEEVQTIDLNISNGWRILIPKINVNAPILNGTTNENMRRGVAHFEESTMLEGNVCLAAHNRGYKYNYFQDIDKLEVGDIIIYKTEEETKKYEVKINTRIKETDWSYLKETKENKITLITCVKNLPEYRTCIQAEEIKT